MSTIDTSIHYRTTDQSNAKYQSLVAESVDYAVVARRMAFNAERFADVMLFSESLKTNLQLFGYPVVTYIVSHSFDDGSGVSTPERAAALEVLVSCLLNDPHNSLIFIQLHDMYECDAPVFEKLGFIRYKSMEEDGTMLYAFHPDASLERF